MMSVLHCQVTSLITILIVYSISGLPLEDDVESPQVSYSGHKLLRTSVLNSFKMAEDMFRNLDEKPGVYFWAFPKVHAKADILISPDAYQETTNLLHKFGIHYDLLHDDISLLLKAEKPEDEGSFAKESRQTRQGSGGMNWKSYRRYADILTYCQSLAHQSGVNGKPQVTIETIGKTTENRDIVLMRIFKGDSRARPAIWLDGGMHAREWISPATVTYILDTLVNNPAKSKELLDAFEWYIVPVVNVDGYEYTHTTDRFWRKTRARTNSVRGCRGVDPNRNWGFKWGGEGSSNNPCSDIYRGPSAFSEPETKAVSNAILARADQIKMYLSFHSYSQLLLMPWGYTKQRSNDYNDLYSLGVKGTEALEATYGTKYKVGTAPDLIYVAAGGSDDWAKGGAGIKYSFTFELRDQGETGFALPPNQIESTGVETFNAVKALALNLKTRL